mgnify:CR=1 FL=1
MSAMIWRPMLASPQFFAITIGSVENGEDVIAAVVAAVLVAALSLFFQKTGTGRALRAVADDHEAALSIGIPLKTIWVVVWSVAGLVAITCPCYWVSPTGSILIGSMTIAGS